MMANNAILMTKQQKIDLYLRMADVKDKKIAADMDVANVESALTEAGRVYKAGTVKRASRTRVTYMAVAAIVFLAVLMTACVWSGLAGKALRGLENLFSQKNKSNMMNVAAPKQTAKQKVTESNAPEMPKTQKIVFLSSRDSTDEPPFDGPGTNDAIYSMDKDGTNQTRITELGTYIHPPLISPTGQEVAYEQQGSVWIVGTDGKNNRCIAKGQPNSTLDEYFIYQNPKWSPDGEKVLLSRRRGDACDIAVYNLKDSSLIQITFNGITWGGEWFPSGKRISFKYFTSDFRGPCVSIQDDGSDMRTEFEEQGTGFSGMDFSWDGSRFLLTKQILNEKPIQLMGSYPSKELVEVSSSLSGLFIWETLWAVRENRAYFYSAINSDPDSPESALSVFDADSGEFWTLYTYNNETHEISPQESNHSGDPCYSSLNGNIYRVEMNGRLTQLTDSGTDYSPIWR